MEIERKFLLTGDFRTDVRKSMRISQGYLCSVPERTVRIRVRDDQGFITIKGKGDADGISRYEWEQEIPVNDAQQLLQICEASLTKPVTSSISADTHSKWMNSMVTMRDLSWLKSNWLHLTSLSTDLPGSARK